MTVTSFPRRLSQGLQAAALEAAFAGLRGLGPVRASDLGGRIARALGPRLPVSRVGDSNLRAALPALDAMARRRIIRAVWDNLGRTVAELPHLGGLRRTAHGPGWELVGEEHLARVTPPLLFVSGHFANWEVMLPIASRYGLALPGFYRAASNPLVDGVVDRMRRAALAPGVELFAKGPRGARAALSHLQAGGSLGMLVDQKMNDGIAVPFFGRPAMTAPAMAQLALRFGLPIIPAHILRLGPARFRMIVEAPLSVPLTGERHADIHAITLAMNATLERWIRAHPTSWLWLHRRWPKETRP
ncbi:lysophospholipid acyltransferase family protein [Lichenicoccus sp.]|uniref:lysophospholipid acyltransferase family protein n=1 Tax=Lichenicoccus sp. TaxID=2781899 RepID=UPI003D0C42F6